MLGIRKGAAKLEAKIRNIEFRGQHQGSRMTQLETLSQKLPTTAYT